MPRQSRIDAPGALHHIIVRGIERRKIFIDDQYRHDFIDRLDNILEHTETGCYAWALIPNIVIYCCKRAPLRSPLSWGGC